MKRWLSALLCTLLLFSAPLARAKPPIAFVPIGDQLIDPVKNPRGVGSLGTGYSFYSLTNGLMTQLYNKGFRRFVVWETFGRMPAVQTWSFTRHGFPCSYDTVLSITDWPDLQALAKTFPAYAPMVSSFVPAMQQFKQSHPDVKLYFYVGTSMGNPDLEKLATTAPDQLTLRLQQCLAPYLAVGADGLIFDSAASIPPDHWMIDCFKRLQTLGIKVFVEAAPSNYPYQVKTGFFSSLEQLANVPGHTAYTVPSAANGAFVGFLDPAMVEGERIGFEAAAKPASYPTTLAWLQATIPDAVQSYNLDSVCIASSWFINDPSMQGMSSKEFEYLVANQGVANARLRYSKPNGRADAVDRGAATTGNKTGGRTRAHRNRRSSRAHTHRPYRRLPSH